MAGATDRAGGATRRAGGDGGAAGQPRGLRRIGLAERLCRRAGTIIAAPLAVAMAIHAAGCLSAPRLKRSEEDMRIRRELAERRERFYDGRPLGIAECENIAIENNLDYRIALLQADIQDEIRSAARAGFLPKVDAEYRIMRRSNEPLISMGRQEIAFQDRQIQSFQASGLLTLLDFGLTYFAYQNAKDRREQVLLLTWRARQTLLRDVRIAYANHVAAMRRARCLEASEKAAREALRVATVLEREGMATPASREALAAALKAAETNLANARRQCLATRMVLTGHLGFTPDTNVLVRDELPPDQPPPANVIGLAESGLAKRPELFVQDLARRIAANDVRSSVAEFFPRVTGILNFNWSDASKEVNPAYFMWGLSIAQNLFSGGATLFKHRVMKINVRIEDERALLAAMAVMYETGFRWLECLSRYDALALAEKRAASESAALAEVEAHLREGVATLADKLAVEARLQAARGDIEAARAAYLQSLEELEAACLAKDGPPPDMSGRAPLRKSGREGRSEGTARPER
ncbi:MAG: TolC family protein [Planctomycetota bacterium]|nr:TolC family protein [Planctomycetota bacterium]